MRRHFNNYWAAWYFGIFACGIIFGMLAMAKARAHDSLHYVQAPADWQKWFGEAKTTEESRPRLAAQGFVWHSCCNRADRVTTQFRVSENKPYADEWHYLDPVTQRWTKLENDIIHYEDDPKMPTQLKVEGVLFVYNGVPTCFWAPQEGG